MLQAFLDSVPWDPSCGAGKRDHFEGGEEVQLQTKLRRIVRHHIFSVYEHVVLMKVPTRIEVFDGIEKAYKPGMPWK